MADEKLKKRGNSMPKSGKNKTPEQARKAAVKTLVKSERKKIKKTEKEKFLPLAKLFQGLGKWSKTAPSLPRFQGLPADMAKIPKLPKSSSTLIPAAKASATLECEVEARTREMGTMTGGECDLPKLANASVQTFIYGLVPRGQESDDINWMLNRPITPDYRPPTPTLGSPAKVEEFLGEEAEDKSDVLNLDISQDEKEGMSEDELEKQEIEKQEMKKAEIGQELSQTEEAKAEVEESPALAEEAKEEEVELRESALQSHVSEKKKSNRKQNREKRDIFQVNAGLWDEFLLFKSFQEQRSELNKAKPEEVDISREEQASDKEKKKTERAEKGRGQESFKFEDGYHGSGHQQEPSRYQSRSTERPRFRRTPYTCDHLKEHLPRYPSTIRVRVGLKGDQQVERHVWGAQGCRDQPSTRREAEERHGQGRARNPHRVRSVVVDTTPRRPSNHRAGCPCEGCHLYRMYRINEDYRLVQERKKSE